MAEGAGSGRRFVGRPEVVEALHQRLGEAQAGGGGVTLLVGNTGVGKSTLVDELAGEIRARGVQLLFGRALALDDPPPYSLLHAAFDSLRDNPTFQSEEESALGEDQLLPELTPLLAQAALPARVGIEQRLLEALDQTEERRGRARDRFLAGLVDTFRGLTERGPTALLLDELHRADDSSLHAIEFLARQLKDRPLWILGTSRPFGSLSETGRARMEAFERATHAQQILLRPLSAEEVEGYLRMSEPSRKFSREEVARRYAQTGGNPLLLRQLMRRISHGGRVRAPSGSGRAVVDEEAQRILEVAAVLGPEFTFHLLLSASGENPDRLTEVVDGLVDQGVLLERPGELLEFTQERLREETYDQLSDSRRRDLHQRAGEARESMGSESPNRIFGLARDFYLGGVDSKSIEYNRIAAEIADGASAPDVAHDFLSRALESQRELVPEDWEAEAELVLELGRVTYELGRLEEAEQTLRNFLDRAAGAAALSPRLRASLEVYLVRVLTARGDLSAATALAKNILSRPGLEDQLTVRLGAHSHLGLALYYNGQYAEALEESREAIRLAREAGNERALAHAKIWQAGCLAMMGQMDQALVGAREVAAVLDRSGSVGESAQGHLFLGNLLADDRSTPAIRQEAVAELQKAIRFGSKAQDPRRVGWAFYHIAELLRSEGRLEEALVNAQQACDTLARIGDRVGQAVSMKIRGQIALDRGAYDVAETDLMEAHRLLGGRGNRLQEIDVLLRLAQLSSAHGDRPAAVARVEELERMNLPTARPDLATEFRQLKDRLAGSTPGGGVG